MIREVELASYLPAFMQKYKEPVAALKAEDPEFALVWTGVDRILYNHFIATADEYGIARFEKLLGICPSREDDLESRRMRVQSRWVNKIPYTIRALAEKIRLLGDGADFRIEADFGQNYGIRIQTMLEMAGQVGELERIVEETVPCNIEIWTANDIPVKTGGEIYGGGGIVYTDIIEIENQEAQNGEFF